MSNHTSHQTISKPQSRTVSNKTLMICLAVAFVALIAVTVFKVSASTLLIGAVLLACPLMHFWMMKDMDHK